MESRALENLDGSNPFKNIKADKDSIRDGFETPKYEKVDVKVVNYIPCMIFRPKPDKPENEVFKQPLRDNNTINFHLELNQSKYVIIYSHGNASDIGVSFSDGLSISNNLKCDVVLYEYPKYGLCKNHQPLNEDGVFHNLYITYLYVKNVLKYPSEKIILYGNSLGTGATLLLAKKLKKGDVGGIILQNPFKSIVRIFFDIGNTSWFDLYPNIDNIQNLDFPFLIISGSNDRMVPFSHGEDLSQVVKKGFLFEYLKVEGGTHENMIETHENVIFNKINDFLSILSMKYVNVTFEEMNTSRVFTSNKLERNEKHPWLRRRASTSLNCSGSLFKRSLTPGNTFLSRNSISVQPTIEEPKSEEEIKKEEGIEMRIE